MIRRRDLLIPAQPHPLAVYLLALCALSGALGLLGVGQRSPSHLPPWADTAWYVLLTAGGLLALVGKFLPDAPTGLVLERSAMWWVAAGAGMYGAGLMARHQWLAAVAIIGFSVAAAARAVQIRRYGRRR